MGARPEGITQVDNKQITFEHPELFNPEEDVYVYEIDSASLNPENLRKVDEKQYVVVGLKKLTDLRYRAFKARELLKYYELKNWSEGLREGYRK